MNNFLFLLKNSLTIWILPALLIAVILKKYNIVLEEFINFTNGLVFFYALLFIITKTNFISEYKKILIKLKYYLLTVISISVFYSNTEINQKYILLISLTIILFFILYSVFAIKKLKKYSLNFDIFKNIFELFLCVSIIFFGTQNILTKYIVVTGMCEIVYMVFFLTIYIYLKKLKSVSD